MQAAFGQFGTDLPYSKPTPQPVGYRTPSFGPTPPAGGWKDFDPSKMVGTFDESRGAWNWGTSGSGFMAQQDPSSGAWSWNPHGYIAPPAGGTPGAPPQGPQPQYDPAAAFNQRPTGGLPGLNTSGVNPYLGGGMGGLNYLQNPLMSGFYGMQNPLYTNQQQQNFYGDPELFSGGY